MHTQRSTLLANALRNAAQNGHLPVLRQLEALGIIRIGNETHFDKDKAENRENLGVEIEVQSDRCKMVNGCGKAVMVLERTFWGQFVLQILSFLRQFLNRSMSSNVYQLAAISHPDFAGANLLMPDGEGRIAFHMAAAGGQVAAMKLLRNMTHTTLATLVSARDGDGHTPLHAAAERGHLKVVRQLLRWKAKLDDQSHRKSCPLHMAARHGHGPVLSFLLENSADIKSQDETGAQPLHLAVRSGSKRAVQILLQAGAQVDSKNNEGKQPLHVATGEGHDAIATLLLNARSDIRAAGVSQKQKTLARSPEDVKLSGLKAEIHGEFWKVLSIFEAALSAYKG